MKQTWIATEVWESEVAWRQFSPDLEIALSTVDPDVRPRTVFRDLSAMHLVVGEALRGAAPRDLVAVGPGVVVAPEISGKERGT